MFSQKIINKKGFTLVEILVVIGIMATLSVLFIVSIKTTDRQRFNIAVDNLANDFRYIRNLAVSRTVYEGVYPGKYGIKITNGNGTNPASYVLYAGSWNSNKILKTVTLSDPIFRVGDFNASTTIAQDGWTGYFEFIDENAVSVSNITLGTGQQYQLFLQYPSSEGGVNGYIRAVLLLGQKSGDNFIWGNIGNYGSFASFVCPNGIVETGEQCDDGNNIETDGCRHCVIFPVRDPVDDPIEQGGGGI